jgi:hypothetical protein
MLQCREREGDARDSRNEEEDNNRWPWRLVDEHRPGIERLCGQPEPVRGGLNCVERRIRQPGSAGGAGSGREALATLPPPAAPPEVRSASVTVIAKLRESNSEDQL